MPWAFDLDHAHGLPLHELSALLGGKAANLAVMATELGLPVPPGFTITTAACREYLAGGWPAGLDDELRAHMSGMEERLGRRFGDPADPLLVSVRSGAPVSMPGMLDTILDLGLDDDTEAGLAATSGDAGFAAECRHRFREMYRGIVGVEAPDDPWEQLRGAVEAVFRSWHGERARAYRRREGIPDDLGTGVTIQAMVFGNRGTASATGVLFSRDPATGEAAFYGDVLFGAQGEDVVAGKHAPEPLSVLDERLPVVAGELRDAAARLERHYRDLCDIEFTVEQGRLWLLQVRVGKRSPQAALRIAVDMADDPGFPLSREEAVIRVAPLLADPPLVATRRVDGPAPLAVGLPASPGVASGGIATTIEAIDGAVAAGRPVILARSETSPEDVAAMARSAGILTTRGGLASHAAVVARGWGIPAVVGASAVEVADDGVRIDGRTLRVGEVITIDGSTGEVFAGEVAGSSVIAPEAAILLGWAHDLGIEIGEEGAPAAGKEAATGDAEAPNAGTTPATAGALAARPATADDILRALLIKGMTTTDPLAVAAGCAPADAGPLVEQLVAGGLVEAVGDAYRLTGEGKLRALAIVAAEGERLGADAAAAALEGFQSLDLRMKEIVTAWQMRPAEGERVINDHSDAAYDAAVLGRLAALHGDAAAWLSALAAGLPRLEGYRARLGQALALARDGDARYVASPRVDSYHGAWFELHEDLIRLAGRTRAEEAAAGRA